MKTIAIICLAVILIPKVFSSEVHLELGEVENSYNQVQIPGDDGTRFNLRSSIDDNNFYYRLQFIHLFDEKHGMRLLYAPLKFTGDKTYSKDIDFNGGSFNAGSEIDTTFKFNSYRATYFYQYLDQEKLKLRLGLSLKVRDAEIRLKQGSTKKSRKDLGFVPLFYLYSEYHFSRKFLAALDFDGLVGPSGRAFDVALMGGYHLDQDWQLQLGARILEGGADNDKVYTFSQFNYYFMALKYSF